MLSGFFYWLGNLHGDNNFDQGVKDVCYEIADALKEISL